MCCGDFDLRAGEILAIIGDNGAGKSTMIKAISGAVVPDAGQVTLDGKTVSFKSPMQAREAGIETVYQNLALSPALSIADNMFLGREIRKKTVPGKWMRMLDRKAMEQQAREKLWLARYYHGRAYGCIGCQGVPARAGAHTGR